MNTTFADLWRPSGTVDRKTYALVGLAGFAIKHNLDRVIATLVFRRPWSLFNYWAPVSHFVRITELRSGEANFLLTMVALPLKMALRLLWHIKYVWITPWFNV